MPNFTGKSGGGPHAMKMYGEGKNPLKFNEKLKAASEAGKLSGDFKDAVDNSALNMYGKPHKMHGDKPMKMHSKPHKMYGKKK